RRAGRRAAGLLVAGGAGLGPGARLAFAGLRLVGGLLVRIGAAARRDLHAEEAGQADVYGGARLARRDLPGDGQRAVDRDGEAERAAAAGRGGRAGGSGVRGGDHADDLPRVVRQRTARVALLDLGVGLQHVLQVLGAVRALVAGLDRAVQGVDDALRGPGPAVALGVAEREHRRAQADLRGVAEVHRGQPGRALKLEQGHVIGGVVAEDLGREVLILRRRQVDAHAGGLVDDVVVGQHEPRG